MENKHENYWYAIETVTKMIRASEFKAGLIISFYSIFLGLIFDQIDFVQSYMKGHIFLYVMFTAWGICTVLSIFFSFKCFIPRLEGQHEDNVFYFGDVASSFGDFESYTNILKDVIDNEDKLFRQLSQQIYINSKIATIKFKFVNRSIRCIGFSFLFILSMLMYLLIF